MKRNLVRSVIYVALFCTGIAPAFAAPLGGETLGTDFAIVYQTAKLDFEPKSLYSIQESGVGIVRQFPAALWPMRDKDNARHYIFASIVPVRRNFLGSKYLHSAFFFRGKEGEYASTPVRRVMFTELLETSRPSGELVIDITRIQEELKVLRVRSIDLREKLDQMGQEASKVVDVEKIVELKVQIEAAEQGAVRTQNERARVAALGEIGRSLGEPKEIDVIQKVLFADLTEAAKITAMADRLDRRKQNVTKHEFMRKLSLIKEMENTNAEDLAKEVIRTRAKRRELENRLGITSADDPNQF